mgnify:CR=1 FL=1
MAFLANGDFLIANWGTDAIETMTRQGQVRRILDRIDGQALGKANFPLRDSRGRLYFTVTTRMQPWTDSINARARDGYITDQVSGTDINNRNRGSARLQALWDINDDASLRVIYDHSETDEVCCGVTPLIYGSAQTALATVATGVGLGAFASPPIMP